MKPANRARSLGTLLPALLPAFLFGAGCAANGAADANVSAPPAVPVIQEGQDDPMVALMAKMAELATPGEAHAELAKSAGSFKVEGSSWWEPGGEAMPMVATAEREMLLGGRMLKESFHSSFAGMPFEGILLQGYDNLKGEHWSIWFDNMSTWGLFSSGDYDDKGELVLDGEMRDAKTPEGRPVRSVVHEIDDDRVNFKMYDSGPDGELWLVMDMNYTRVK